MKISSELNRLRRKKEFQTALRDIYETPSGKVFFRYFMEQCFVTKPRFSKDPMEINWNESRRHLAMSYLNLLAQDDLEAVMRNYEESLQKVEEENYE